MLEFLQIIVFGYLAIWITWSVGKDIVTGIILGIKESFLD